MRAYSSTSFSLQSTCTRLQAAIATRPEQAAYIPFMRSPNRRRLEAPAFIGFFSIDARLSSGRVFFILMHSNHGAIKGVRLNYLLSRRAAADITLTLEHHRRQEPGSHRAEPMRKGPSRGPFLSWHRYVCRGSGPASRRTLAGCTEES